MKRVADLAILPGDEVYNPPAESRCDTYSSAYPLDVGEDLYGVQRIFQGKVVHFSLEQRTRCARCQAWHVIRRVDTTHGVLHEHRFKHGEDESERPERTVPLGDIPPNEAGYDFVTREFELQWNRMVEGWEVHRRAWGESA